MYELTREGGLLDRIKKCRELQHKLKHEDYGDVDEVNKACGAATEQDESTGSSLYINKGTNGWFDITHPGDDSFPPMYLLGYLNQHHVQKALGVPVNFTWASPAVGEAFHATGDMPRAGFLEDIAYVLDHGVRVAMMYGDRDYACNWVQGEQSSLKIPWQGQEKFAQAGYAPLVVSPVHAGGLTRQYGNLSFTRVYQAGHEVPAYQPEASYQIFMRALAGKDIATGTIDVQEAAARGEQYATKGPGDTWWMKNEVLPPPAHECYILEMGRCTEEEKSWVFNGTAIVTDWIVTGHNDSLAPEHISPLFTVQDL
jgi:hypothetical protein